MAGGSFSRRIELFVDRISEGVAILISSDPEAEIAVCVTLLPEGVSEGDWLNAIFERDDEKMRQCGKDIDDLMAELGDDP